MDKLIPPKQLLAPITPLAVFIMCLVLALMWYINDNSAFIEEKASHCGANSALIRTLTIWDSDEQKQKIHYKEVYGCVYYDDIRVYPIPGEDQ